MDVGRYWSWAFPLAVAGVTVSWLVLLTTFVAGDPLLPGGVVFVLFAAAAPVHVGSVLTMMRRRVGALPTVPWTGGLSGDMPKIATVVLAGSVTVAGLIFVGGFFQSSGSPEKIGDRYFLNSHGERTEVSRDEYIDRKKSDQRAFAAVSAVFCAVGVGVGSGTRRRGSAAESDHPRTPPPTMRPPAAIPGQAPPPLPASAYPNGWFVPPQAGPEPPSDTPPSPSDDFAPPT
jgi:hypothetical protein